MTIRLSLEVHRSKAEARLRPFTGRSVVLSSMASLMGWSTAVGISIFRYSMSCRVCHLQESLVSLIQRDSSWSTCRQTCHNVIPDAICLIISVPAVELRQPKASPVDRHLPCLLSLAHAHRRHTHWSPCIAKNLALMH